MDRRRLKYRVSGLLAVMAIALSACTGATATPGLTYGTVFAGPTASAVAPSSGPAADTSSPTSGAVAESSGGPVGAPATGIAIYLSEWSVGLPTSIVAGQINFAITNIGTMPHELVVFRSTLSPSAYPVDAKGDIIEDGPGITLVSKVSPIAPGVTQKQVVDLTQPGTYMFVCNLPGHFKAGMFRVVTVTPTSAQQAYIPAALSEWHIAAPTTIKAGSVILEAGNFGTIQHELLVFKSDLAPSQYPVDANGNIVEAGPGISLVSDGDNIDPGATQTRTVDLTQPGTYLFVCNIPGHFKAGMYSAITVTP
ncbi:MAG TPA: sulfocyanin-like copper-binding protein [Candidatus Limnocylindrales bacterium]|nr:sulfocyanin-like copper-binding protein [Candidatus Limnocylindrales bacterium]